MTPRPRPTTARSPVANREEILRMLTMAARDGSVSAMKTLIGERRREQDEAAPASVFEALDNVREIRSA